MELKPLLMHLTKFLAGKHYSNPSTIWTNSKLHCALCTHMWLPNTSHYKCLLYLPPSGRNFAFKICPTAPPPCASNLTVWLGWRWGVRVELGVENGTNQNFDTTFLFNFYTHWRPILHHLSTIQNEVDRKTTDRHNDRNSIVDLKTRSEAKKKLL